jgi:hypothetical protein
MTIEPILRSKPLPASAAHELAARIEHLGVDHDDIRIQAAPPAGEPGPAVATHTPEPQQARRAPLAAAYGAAVAFALALIVFAGWGIDAGPILLLPAAVGAALGALAGLLSARRPRTATSRFGADQGRVACVEASLHQLDDLVAQDARVLVNEAEVLSGSGTTPRTGVGA